MPETHANPELQLRRGLGDEQRGLGTARRRLWVCGRRGKGQGRVYLVENRAAVSLGDHHVSGVKPIQILALAKVKLEERGGDVGMAQADGTEPSGEPKA